MKLFDFCMKGILTSSLPAVIAPLNNAVEAVNGHFSVDWAQYDKYIFPAGDHKIVKNESGQICGLLVCSHVFDPEAASHEPHRVRAICACPQHAPRAKRHLQTALPCQRQRPWKVSAGEEPQMPDRVLARWLVEGALHDSTAKHMASRHY